MKTVTVNVYNYNELPAVSQRRARDGFYEKNLEYAFDEFSDYAKDSLETEYGIEAELDYSLTFCQGDGFSFETDNLLTEKVYQYLFYEDCDYFKGVKDKELLRMVAEGVMQTGWQILVGRGNRRYSYASESDVDAPESDDVACDILPLNLPIKENAKETIMEYYDILVEGLRKLYMDICKGFEKDGYDCYDEAEQMTDADLAENMYFWSGEVYAG